MLSLREVKSNIQKYVDAECVKYVKSVLDELNGEALYTHQALQRQVQRLAKDYNLTAKQFMDKYVKMIDENSTYSKNEITIKVEDNIYEALIKKDNISGFVNKCIEHYYKNKDNNYLTEDLFNKKISESQTEITELISETKSEITELISESQTEITTMIAEVIDLLSNIKVSNSVVPDKQNTAEKINTTQIHNITNNTKEELKPISSDNIIVVADKDNNTDENKDLLRGLMGSWGIGDDEDD